MKGFLFISLFHLFNFCFSQINQIDSLKMALTLAKDDTSRCNILSILTETAGEEDWLKYNAQLKSLAETNLRTTDKLLNKIFKKYQAQTYNNMGYQFDTENNFKSAYSCYFKSLGISEEIKNTKGIADVLNNIAALYKREGKLLQALEYLNKSLLALEETGDKKGIATSYNNIAFIYNSQGKIEEALKYYDKSLRIREDIHDESGMAESLSNIGLIYDAQGELLHALDYYKKSLKITEKTTDLESLALVLNSIGMVYCNLNDLKKGSEFIERGLSLQKEIGDSNGVALSLNNLGTVYYRYGDNLTAEKYFTAAVKLKDQLKDVERTIAVQHNLIHIYCLRKKYSQALDLALNSMKISQKLGYPENIRNTAKLLNTIYSAKGNYQKALENLELFVLMRDSLNNEETKKASIKNKLQYEYDKKEIEIKARSKADKEKIELQAAENSKRQNLIICAVIAGLVIVLTFSIFMFRSLQENKKKNKIITHQKHLVDEKQKEILDSIHYAKRIQTALLPHETYIARVLGRD